MNIQNFNFNKKNGQSKNILVDYSGIGILFGMTIQAFALIPIIVKVAQKKTAEEISFVTPVMFLFSFIIFGVISLAKKFYLPLIIFVIGIVTSAMLLVQKLMYEKYKNDLNSAPIFDLSNNTFPSSPSPSPARR